MKDEEIDAVIVQALNDAPMIYNSQELAAFIRAALRAHDMEVRPMEPGIGFFDSVGRALCAAYEKDGPDQLTDEFRAWNEARKAP